MRLGVIDIGSNTVHLLVVDAYPGAHPLPSSSHKIALRLSEGMTADGSVSGVQTDRLVEFVRECVKLSDDQGVEDLVSFATSAVREAPNGQSVLDRVAQETGGSAGPAAVSSCSTSAVAPWRWLPASTRSPTSPSACRSAPAA